MEIKVNAEPVIRGFKRLSESDYIRIGLEEACQIVRNEAQDVHGFASHTLNLERAIEYKVHPEALEGEVFINGDVAPYGIFVHEPTGKFAPPDKRLASKYHRYPDGSYEIRPSRFKALRFIDQNGEEVFAKRVRHPGSKADRFLYKAAEAKEDAVVEAFRAAVQTATKEAFL